MSPLDLQKLFKRKFPPCGKFRFINNVWVHYYESFPEAYDATKTKTVVMIHGLSGSMHDFLLSPMMSDLKRRYHIICIDRPGAGYSYISDEKQITLEDKTDIIKELFKQLNVNNPIIVGHSLGGALVLNFAALNPDYDAKYLLLAPLIYPVRLMYIPFLFLLNINFIRWIVFRIILIVQTLFFHQLIKNAFRPNADLLTSDYEEITKDQLSTWIQLKAEFNNLRTVRKTLENNCSLYKGITKPITMLVGKNDKIIPSVIHAEKLVSINSSIKVTYLSHVGHMINFASPTAIIAEIDAFSSL